MDDIMEIVKSLEDSGLLLKGVTRTIENKIKEQRREFLSMLLSTIGIILLRNILSHKGLIWVGDGVIRAGNGIKKERRFNAASSFD